MAFYTDTFSAKFSFAHSISAAWDAYKSAASKRAAYNRTLRELSTLSDRDLADLGLHRTQIRSIAHSSAYKA